MRFMLRYLRPFFGKMSIGLIIKISGTLAELTLPYILSHILKNVVVTQQLSHVIFWGGAMALGAAVACVCNIIANRMAARVSRNFSERVRHDLFARTLRLSAAQTDRFTIPSLESRITTDTYNLHGFVSMMQRMGVRAPIMLAGGIIITIIMDRFLALTMIAVLPLLFFIVTLISRRGVPLYTKVQKSVDDMVRVVREDSQGIRVIKALSKTEHEHRRYDRANSLLVKNETRAGVVMGAANPVMTLCMNAGIVAVVAMSAARVAGHLSDPETVIAFMQYFTLISMAMMSVSRIFTMYTKSAASAKRIEEVINTPDDLVIESADKFPDCGTAAHIKFDRVSFSYAGVRDDLTDVSFELPRGGTLGIIGATGSGKSTLIKLLMRFYDTDSGSIYINGKNVRTIPQDTLHGMFGTAMQNDFIYAASVEDNIRFGRDVSHEQIVSAAKTAQADGFIRALDGGYEHRLSPKGTNVSGGQRQRLFIARALAARPEILILDDSSSALDYRTDAMLRRALKADLADTTVITVAQRVSSVKGCDLILVLDEGRIIGCGRHEELMQSCAEYREISMSQMGGAFVD